MQEPIADPRNREDSMNRRPIITGLALVVLVLVALVALPALAAGPNASPGQSGKPAKSPESQIARHGTIEAATDSGGAASYTLTDGGTTYTLEAGPPWFWGDNHPLKPFVGKTVTVVGEVAKGSTKVDVESVNGTAIRSPGKPPWAGGWHVVGPRHPGWSQEKADRFKAKFGDCFPPGQCKDKTTHAEGSPEPGDAAESPEPEESESP